MEREGLIELNIDARDYSKYYLTKNPFPAIGIPEEFPRITIDRETIKQRFQNVISEVINTNRTIVTVMVGEYGSGKSHLFKLFKNSVNAQLLTSKTGALGIYIKSPGEEFSDLFFSIIDGIGKELLLGQVHQFLHRQLYASDNSKLIHNAQVREDYLSQRATVDQILSNSQYISIFNTIYKDNFKEIKNQDLVFALFNLAHNDRSTKSWRWLLGQHLLKDDLQELNLQQTIQSSDAYQNFLDFVKILRVIGIRYLVLLIDELEKITLLPSTKRANYQDQLRQMIDDNPNGMCLYFAIAPRQWDALTKEPTALVRRLVANYYILKDFQPSETRELIEAYLFTSRTSNYSAEKITDVIPKCEPSLYPFTTLAVEAISKKGKGVVSNILALARISLEILGRKARRISSNNPRSDKRKNRKDVKASSMEAMEIGIFEVLGQAWQWIVGILGVIAAITGIIIFVDWVRPKIKNKHLLSSYLNFENDDLVEEREMEITWPKFPFFKTISLPKMPRDAKYEINYKSAISPKQKLESIHYTVSESGKYRKIRLTNKKFCLEYEVDLIYVTYYIHQNDSYHEKIHEITEKDKIRILNDNLTEVKNYRLKPTKDITMDKASKYFDQVDEIESGVNKAGQAVIAEMTVKTLPPAKGGQPGKVELLL